MPSTLRENAIATILFVLAILFGVFPSQTILRYMDKTVEAQSQDLTDWTKDYEAAAAAKARAADVVHVAAPDAIKQPSFAVSQVIGDGTSAAETVAVTVHESPSVIEQQ